MNKSTDRTAQTKQNLMDAFWDLYCVKRMEKITVKEIANKAGYNRGTFYEYFADVFEVLEVIENSLIPTLDELPPVSTESGSIGMSMDGFFAFWEQNAKYYAVLLGDHGDPAFAGKLKNKIKPAILKEIEVQTDIDLDELDYILEYTLSAMIGVMNHWFREDSGLSKEELFRLLHRLNEEGIRKHLPL